jgi:hypothetical protein
MRHLRNIAALIDNHLIARITGRPSTSQFWYSPTAVTISAGDSLHAYLAGKQPVYPIDYSSRLAFPLAHPSGAVLLPYGPPIGDRINPEASFQTALGWHMRHCASGDAHARERFLSIAEFFLLGQTTNGDLEYDFDWFESKAPWTSALSQSRGASVFMRAFLLTGETRFADAANAAISRFSEPAARGGYMIAFEDGAVFFEEYPKRSAFTFNGFLVCLIGLFELSHFLGSTDAERLFRAGIDALERHGEKFFSSWWTLYDLDRAGGMANVHSPMYHRMVSEYLEVLALLSGSAQVAALLHRARRTDHVAARSVATVLKLIRKARVR